MQVKPRSSDKIKGCMLGAELTLGRIWRVFFHPHHNIKNFFRLEICICLSIYTPLYVPVTYKGQFSPNLQHLIFYNKYPYEPGLCNVYGFLWL